MEEINMEKEYKFKQLEYEQVEGIFTILRDGKFLIGKKELGDGDIIHLQIGVLKDIIQDAKADIIQKFLEDIIQ